MQRSDGMNYAPKGKPQPVVEPGQFTFAAAALDHGHIHGQCNGLLEAGAGQDTGFQPARAVAEEFGRTNVIPLLDEHA